MNDQTGRVQSVDLGGPVHYVDFAGPARGRRSFWCTGSAAPT